MKRILFAFALIVLYSCSDSPTEQLFDFTRNNRIAKLKRLLSESEPIKLDTVDMNGISPLAYAIGNYSPDLVKLLIDNGAHVNYYQREDYVPFHHALTLMDKEFEKDSLGINISKKDIILGFLLHEKQFVIDKNTDKGTELAKLIAEINHPKVREMALKNVIESKAVLLRRKRDSILAVRKWIEDSIAWAKESEEHNRKALVKIVKNPHIRQTDSSITFALNDVKTTKKPLEERNYKWALQARPIRRIEYYNKENYRMVPSRLHPFAMAVEMAYAQHRPLTISPDMIWLMICQGVSKHIELNKDSLRSSIVDFGEKKRIDIIRPDFELGKADSLWKDIISEFAVSTRKNIVDTSLYSTVVHSFSTTGKKELLTYNITFLEINRHYFQYMLWACGIPEVTLEGKTEDWVWIRKNMEKFRKLGLSWWIDKVNPILDEFVNTSNGDVHLTHWSNIYSNNGMCGADKTGWYSFFFPYIRNGKSLKKNPLITKGAINKGDFVLNAIEDESFTSGLSYVNFTVVDKEGKSHDLSFVAGFVGIKQNRNTKALRPEINWLVTR